MKNLRLSILLLPLAMSSCGTNGNAASCTSYPASEDLSSYALDLEIEESLDLIGEARSHYGDFITRNEIISGAGFVKGDSLKANYDTLFRLLKSAFSNLSDGLSKVGSRKYAGYFSKPVSSRSISEEGKEAFEWFVDLGLWGSDSYKGGDKISLSTTKTLLQRIFSYIGASEKDDYFTYANSDRLFDSKVNASSSSYYYQQKIVDQSNINEFYCSYLNEVAPNLYEDFNSENNLSGLSQYVNKIYNSTSGNFYDNLIEVSKQLGSYFFKFEGAVDSSSATKYFYLSSNWFIASASYASAWSSSFAELFKSFGFDASTANSLASSLSSSLPNLLSTYYSSAPNEGFARYMSAMVGENNSYAGYDSVTKVAISSIGKLNPSNDADLTFLKALSIASIGANYAALLPETIRGGFGLGDTTDSSTFLSLTSSALGEYFVNSYSESENGKESFQIVSDLNLDIAETIKERLENNDWLSEDGKNAVSDKLEAMKFSIAGVEGEGNAKFSTVADVSSLETALVSGYSSYWNNLREESKTIDKTMELTLRYGDLFVANAAYYPQLNRVEITMGLLASYGADVNLISDEDLYGALASVLGHEITHSIDADGVCYDKNGNYAPNTIFSALDQVAYKKKQAAIKKLYTYEALPGCLQSVDTTLSEDIADCSGVLISEKIYEKSAKSVNWDAYYKSLVRHFFSTCSRYTYNYVIKSDGHSFGKARVNPFLSNSENFVTYYKIGQNDGMYVAPEDRVVIW